MGNLAGLILGSDALFENSTNLNVGQLIQERGLTQ
jgi:hypothetical protein